MDAEFLVKLALSFIVGGGWVMLTTLMAEKFGSKVGGFIGGLPSTVMVALLFIGITQSAAIAAESSQVVPLIQGINGVFILGYIRMARHGFFTGLSTALVVWAGLSWLAILLNIQRFWIILLVWLILSVICVYVVEKVLRISSHPKIQGVFRFGQLALRTFLGGGLIAFAVFIGKVAGPVYGGLFSAFPAMFVSTLIFTYHAGGVAFSQSTAKSLMASGLINVTVYAVAVRYLYVWTGLGPGTLLALGITGFGSCLIYLFIGKKMA